MQKKIVHFYVKGPREYSFLTLCHVPGEMIDKLTIMFNRTRQAVITGELIEIISGAAAL